MNSRYPLSLRKLQDGVILSRRVHDATEESVYVAAGWSPKVPVLPAPPAPLTDDTAAAIATLAEGMAEIGAQITALETRIEKLEQKRGPGRPAKE